MGIFGGRSNYPYVCARVKARKSFLLSKDVYHRMLSMGLAEIGRYLGETQYREEMTTLGAKYEGATLIELGISQNLAQTYSDVISFSGGHLRELIATYLHRWDIYNLKTVLRGKLTSTPIDEISEILIPAGSLKGEFFNQLIQTSSWEELIELLRQQKVIYVDEELLRTAISSGKLAALEDNLDKDYYELLLHSIKKTAMSEKRFSDFVRREIDIVNLKTLVKLKSEGSSGEALSQYFVRGGRELKIDRLTKMAASEGMKDVLEELRQTTYAEYIRAEIDQYDKDGDVSSLLRALDRALLEVAEKFSHVYPLSVLPILDYLLRKKTEVDNIRIIARGKESNIDIEKIRELLVL